MGDDKKIENLSLTGVFKRGLSNGKGTLGAALLALVVSTGSFIQSVNTTSEMTKENRLLIEKISERQERIETKLDRLIELRLRRD